MIPEIIIKYKTGKEDKVTITTSLAAYQLFKQMYDSDTIEFTESSIMILLNRANKSIGWYKISQGGITGTVIDIRVVLGVALKSGATGIIISHNHPSGNLMPSEADKTLTRKLNDACVICDINLIDHLIITDNKYYSFKDDGLL